MIYVAAVFVTLLVLVFLLATVIGLPGPWAMVITAALLAWLVPDDGILALSWGTVGALVGIALLGELIEFVAGAAGVSKLGGSRRAATWAIIGSIVGAVVGIFVALPIPIPVVGSLIGSILLGGVGAAVGAILGERSIGGRWDSSTRIGVAAFLGRIFGTVGKSICAAVMAVLLIVFVWR